MVLCEMCGKEGKLSDAIVEGTILSLCSGCLKYGEVIQLQKQPERNVRSQKVSFATKKPVFVNEEVENLVSDYSGRIRRARDKLGMKQDEVA